MASPGPPCVLIQIDLRQISLAGLLDQLATAGRATPLAQQGDWLVMAAWLVWLRSRLLLSVDAPAQVEAATEAARLRDRLLALLAGPGTGHLARRPAAGSPPGR